MRTDLSQATFIIPIRIESPDRLRNVVTTTAFLLENFDTNIIIKEVDAEPEYDPELPGSKAPEPVQEVPQDDSVLDDTWGEMTGDWGEQGDTLSDAAATTAEIRHENRRGDGPSDAVGATLRPLPGTEIGTDGWYFDPDGRPTHWIHSEESGWSQE